MGRRKSRQARSRDSLITLLVALDGDGTSTFLITVTALLPIYRRIGMRPVVLTGIVALAAGLMNIIPWGGPTARAMAALDMTSGDIFIPLLGPMAVGALWVIAVAWFLGRGKPAGSEPSHSTNRQSTPGRKARELCARRRPKP